MGGGLKNEIVFITIILDITKKKNQQQLMVVCLFEGLCFPTELQNACLIVLIHVCALRQTFHNCLILLKSCFLPAGRAYSIDVVRNTARESTIGCWSGKRHIFATYSVSHQVFVSILRTKEAVFCYPI